MRLEVRKPRSFRSSDLLPLASGILLITNHHPPNTALRPRSDTGLRKQTGEGEAFTGGGKYLPPKMESVPIFG